jgi:hypothetical protein
MVARCLSSQIRFRGAGLLSLCRLPDYGLVLSCFFQFSSFVFSFILELGAS